MTKTPIVETYRGVGIHAYQSPARVAVVKSDIDAVATMKTRALLKAVSDQRLAPEARIFAEALLLAEYQLAVQERRERPPFDVADMLASAAELDNDWRSPTHYRCIADSHDGAVERETPFPGAQ
jgi:hypothetical protein